MPEKNVRLEVMQQLEPKVDGFIDEFLIPVEKIWQPTDFLPNSQQLFQNRKIYSNTLLYSLIQVVPY